MKTLLIATAMLLSAMPVQASMFYFENTSGNPIYQAQWFTADLDGSGKSPLAGTIVGTWPANAEFMGADWWWIPVPDLASHSYTGYWMTDLTPVDPDGTWLEPGPNGDYANYNASLNDPAQTPLPAALPMFVGGLAGLLLLVRRRRNCG